MACANRYCYSLLHVGAYPMIALAALLGVGYTCVLASHKIHFVQTVTIHIWHPVRSLQSSPVLLRNSKHYCISNPTHYSPSLPVPGSDADKHTSAG